MTPSTISALITQRDAARAAKHWAIADQLRDNARSMGYELVNKPGGTIAIPLEVQKVPQSARYSKSTFFVSYIDENGRQWTRCVNPYRS